MPDFRLTDEARHRAALDYIRTRTRDAAPEDPDDTDTDSHVHIHLHRGSDTDLPASTGNATPPPGRSSGNPVLVSNDAEMEEEDPEDYVEPDDEEEGERVVGELPSPPEGQTYQIRENDDGTCSVVLVADDGSDVLNAVNTGDSLRSWSDAMTSSILRNMNKANRAFHTRDSVAAPTKSTTVFTQRLNPDERLEIRKSEDMWELVLVSPTTDLTGRTPLAAEELNEGRKDDDDRMVMGEVSSPGQSEPKMERGAGGRVVDSKMTNKRLNEIHRQYWKR